MMKFRKIMHIDLEFVNRVRNSCAEKYLHDSRTFTYNETVAWFFTTHPDFYIVTENGIRIGYFRLSNHNKQNKTIYIGADMDEEYRGKGLGYKMYSKFIPFLCNMYDVRKLYLEVLSDNDRAIRLYKKLGFEVEGIKKQDVIRNGEYIDSIIMGLFIKN